MKALKLLQPSVPVKDTCSLPWRDSAGFARDSISSSALRRHLSHNLKAVSLQAGVAMAWPYIDQRRGMGIGTAYTCVAAAPLTWRLRQALSIYSPERIKVSKKEMFDVKCLGTLDDVSFRVEKCCVCPESKPRRHSLSLLSTLPMFWIPASSCIRM